tara:strand:+ start:613 stop:1620 length:1008 start_codon:yes stop_codon:yes gene_type:complete
MQYILNNTKNLTPEILNKYSEYIPHTRNKDYFNRYRGHIDLNENVYFFTTIKNFERTNIENILIQGDSWAQNLNHKKSFFKLKNYSINNNFGLINAGITSYSPSAMTSQLNILEKEFEIKPSIIIAIIDQTDIGDELFRYKNEDKEFFLKTLTISNKNFKLNTIDNFNKFNFSSFKLIKYVYDYYLYNKNIFNFSKLEFLDLLYKQTKATIFKIPKVIYPLQYGFSFNEKDTIKKRIQNYIEFAFKNKNLKKIYFVSHPHLKHLDKNKYIINISSIIDEAINETKFKNNIDHINFSNMKESKNRDIYLTTDPFSHLTDDAYSNYYLPTILSQINF